MKKISDVSRVSYNAIMDKNIRVTRSIAKARSVLGYVVPTKPVHIIRRRRTVGDCVARPARRTIRLLTIPATTISS